MKVRLGFVSNSSSTSFSLYGWTELDLGIKINQLMDLYDYIRKNCKDIDIKDCSHPCCSGIIGVGNIETDIDHYIDDWEDYCCNGPSDKEVEALKEYAKFLGIQEPDFHSHTWRDG